MTENLTRQDIITDIQERLEVLTPREISEYAVRLSAHMSNMGEELAEAEKAYYKTWESFRMNTETDGMADKLSKTTPQYKKKFKLEIELKALKELIQALKKRQAVLADEARGYH